MDINVLETEVLEILEKVEKECSWMYETKHSNGKIGIMNYTIWSDVFICPICKNDVVFWDSAIDPQAGEVKDEFNCQSCNSLNTKKP